MANIYLSEFEKLKDEQISRSAHRDRLFHLTLVLFGGGITIALSKDAHMLGLLLLLPVIAFIAGTSHITCDRRISSIGSYIKSTLSKRIAAIEQIPSHEVFEWETFIDSDALRKGRKRTQLMSNIFLYVVSGIGATAWYCYHVLYEDHVQKLEATEIIAVGIDIFLMGLMAWQLLRHAYIGRSKERPERKAGLQTVITMVISGALAVAVAGLAGAAMLHFGPLVLVAPSQPLPFGFSLPWPVTRLDLATVAVVVVTGGFTLLLRRR